MVEEKKYHKVKSKGNPIVFNPNERWIQMKDLSDGTYYISDYGRIARLNPQGIFHELKSVLHCESYYVSIEFSEGNRNSHTRKRVGRLVLKYFVGGEKEKRRYVHLNGDKADCRLLNLRWRKGFVDDVDYAYLKRLNTSKMTEESQIVQDYLMNENTDRIFSLIQSYEKLIKYIDFHNNTGYLKRNDFIGFAMVVLDDLKDGKFKPNVKHREIISFKNFICSTFRRVSYQYKSMREFYMTERQESLLTDNHIEELYLNVV